MRRRMIAAFSGVVLTFALLLSRLSVLSGEGALAEAAQQQATFLLDVADTRGVIYDAAMRPLTGSKERYVAAVLPCEQSADTLLRAVSAAERPMLLRRLEMLTPFVCEVPSGSLYARGLQVFPVPIRYADDQAAVHLIGQLDSATGKGASGLEQAYDQLLTSTGGTLKIRYATDAMRRAIDGAGPEILDSGYATGAGLVLTIDQDIQRIVQQAARTIRRGAVVVMDPYTGDIKASVSCPSYNPNHMEQALADPDAPFINRAFYAYAVGSTFKLLTSSTALEQGIPTARTYPCTGAIEVGNQVFHCHNLDGHGTLDMIGALEKSCNPYFISLALQLGGPTLLYKAQQLGFGSAAELAPGMRTQAGSLPTREELISPAAVANFGFGQGRLTATPLQIATLISAVANGGSAVTPRLVEGTTADGKTFSSRTASYSARPIFLPDAADAVRKMMIAVVEEGSGQKARPETGGAGGKTASAQTGQYDSRGVEVVHAWFSGFFPAEQPRYTVVVLVEGGDSGGDVGAPVFREIANGIAQLKK